VKFHYKFADNKTCHASQRTAHQGEFFYFRAMKYNKPALTLAQQIQKLKERGLQIEDTSRAEKYLSFISYYRLRAYTYPYQNNELEDHPFHKGTTFDMILNTYLFDRELRLVVFDAIERIEIAFRAQIINHFSVSYGTHWFEKPSLFRDSRRLEKDLEQLDKEINRSNEVFIGHYNTKYTYPSRPPVWMCFETSTLSLVSKLYENLQMSKEKKQVARNFFMHPFVLESWMHTLSVVRNICAHHGRLWNRKIPAAPKMLKNPKHTWLKNRNIETNKIYMVLSSIIYLLDSIIPDHHFKNKFINLLTKYPVISESEMGFPESWKQEALWRI